ncbi:PIN domain-containing protein [Bacillus mycoides]|uniref:PIN domain-containing protein n=2 Tax=Bacillus mycoides TaxID=1405 RepID=UPI00365C6866
MSLLYIFLDTNVVKSHNSNLTKFEFNKTYAVLKDYIVENEIENVKVLVPRIVIEELISQYIAEYKGIVDQINNEITRIKVAADRVQWAIEINKSFEKSFRDYKDFIKSDVDRFIEEEKSFLEIVNFPRDEKLVKIIERSVKKKKPFFSGKHNKKDFSDAGFKDVVFLESIIEYLEKNNGEYLIATRDNYFKEIDLDVEINGSSGSLIDKETGKEFVGFLVEKLGIEDFSVYRKFAKSDYYKEAIEVALNCKILSDPLSVNKYENEDEDEAFIEICNFIKYEDEDISIVVRISEEKDFIEILNDNKEEVMYEW